VKCGSALRHTKAKQQQDAKNNAEIETEWIKMTWKTFEEAIS
jgi:hypothetical protein